MSGDLCGTVTLQGIQAAHQRIRDQITDTPCLLSRTLSEITQCQLYLKFENLQFTASFKERGAANRLLTLPPAQTSRGVIAMSAGNHAQGVAYHCQRLQIPATIVMPRFTPFIKVENTERFGANVILEGDTLAQARRRMLELAQAEHLTVVHPYDDPAIIAGQGTIALEMLAAVPELDTLVVAVGGGGLISGIAVAAKALKPSIRIVGVQADHFPAAAHQWFTANPKQNARFETAADLVVAGGPTLAEGIAVEEPGSLTMPIINDLVDDMLLVTEGQVERAILTLLDIEKTVVEGAGAAGLAAVMNHRDRFAGQRVGLVLCGGNIDSLTLSDIVQRQLALSHRLVRLVVSAPDSPGSLARIARIIGELGANIEQVSHQRVFADLPVRYVKVELMLSTRSEDHLNRVIAALEENKLPASQV